ncbi:hypothetical protein OAT84_01840 [Gammaproteobacteria bacterium]|nr:hypothetical protein [Gammaproteobacteria bacterium]
MRYPSFTLNTSIISLAINSATKNSSINYVHFELFGVTLLSYRKLFVKSENEYSSLINIFGISRLKTQSKSVKSYEYRLQNSMLALVGFVLFYVLRPMQFLLVLLPPVHQILSLSWQNLPVLLSASKAAISLLRAILVTIYRLLGGKTLETGWQRFKRTISAFFVPDLLLSLITIPMALYTPYGFWAAVTSIAICSLYKVIAEGSALIRIDLLPSFGTAVFEFLLSKEKSEFRLFRQDLLVLDFKIGGLIDIKKPAQRIGKYNVHTTKGDAMVFYRGLKANVTASV